MEFKHIDHLDISDIIDDLNINRRSSPLWEANARLLAQECAKLTVEKNINVKKQLITFH